MAGSLKFTIEGLTLRGFYETMYHWVPYRGERLECIINPTNGAISAFKGPQSIGNVQTEWSRHCRKWLIAFGKLEAVVCGLHKKHKSKGEEVPVIFVFSGDRKPRLINTKSSIERETEKKARRKKSLKFHNGDESENLLRMNSDILTKVESFERQTEELEFSISGMTIRGFFKYKETWVPEIGSRHECFISETEALATKINGDIISICGHIPTEVQKLWKEFLKKGGKLTAVVADHPKNHRSKGEEVPAHYVFTGEMTCILQNVRRSIIADIEKKKKKKKALSVSMGDSTQRLNVNHDPTASGQSTSNDGERNSERVSNSKLMLKVNHDPNTSRQWTSNDSQKRVSNSKVGRKRGLEDSSSKADTPKKLKNTPRKGLTSTLPGDDSIVLTEKDFSTLSQIIAGNWKLLGRQLGLERDQISRIEINPNYYEEEEKICNMFMEWRKRFPDKNSLENLIKAVNKCPKLVKNEEQYEEFINTKRQ